MELAILPSLLAARITVRGGCFRWPSTSKICRRERSVGAQPNLGVGMSPRKRELTGIAGPLIRGIERTTKGRC
jgi:hypothetical protein